MYICTVLISQQSFCFAQCFADRDIETETDEEKDIEARTKPSEKGPTKASADYYAWSSTGTETEDDGGSNDRDWSSAEESMEGESTEDEEDLTEEETDIKYVYLHIFLKELLLLYKEITPP